MKLNPLDPSNPTYMELSQIAPVHKTATSYNEPGLKPPPAGWGRVLPLTDSVDGDDEGPESPDEY